MGIEWFRDLIICIFGLGVVLIVIVVLVMSIVLFVKVMPIVNSVKRVVKTVENISSCVEEEVVTPLAQVVAFVQGFRKALGIVSQYGKDKEEKHGRER